MAHSPGRHSGLGCLVAAIIAGILVLALLIGGLAWLRAREYIAPTPFEARCRFTASGNSAVLDPNQAHYAGTIVGIAVQRGLPARAGSIAMATAFQESGIRNLDYGDRDSLGLFQQRPSQGWGSEEEILDPVYSTNAFYDALLKVDGWETGDINDVAQTVQRSGHPEAYRQHEANSRIIASVLAGHSPEGVTCGDTERSAADAEALVAALAQDLGVDASVSDDGLTVTYRAASDQMAWAVAHHAVVHSDDTGVASVTVGGRSWTWAASSLPAWTEAAEPEADRTVVVRLAAP